MAIKHAATKGPGDTGYSIEWNADHTGTLNLANLQAGTQGDVLYYNGTNWTTLGAGTDGYFLKTQGAGANPIWSSADSSDYGKIILNEIADPANPSADKAYLFIKDDGAGKTQLCVKFSSGATQVLATQV